MSECKILKHLCLFEERAHNLTLKMCFFPIEYFDILLSRFHSCDWVEMAPVIILVKYCHWIRVRSIWKQASSSQCMNIWSPIKNTINTNNNPWHNSIFNLKTFLFHISWLYGKSYIYSSSNSIPNSDLHFYC